MVKKNSRNSWMQEHLKDPFVRKAELEGYRSRASYKLLEMDRKFKLIKPNMRVVDLGAAPGGWSQVIHQRLVSAGKGSTGKIVALDLLPMEPIPGVEFIQGDFQEKPVLEKLSQILGPQPLDLVISDMAPNLSGMKVVDQPRAVYLSELVLDLADKVLKEGGSLITKCFEGEGIDILRKGFKDRFKKVSNFKPEASKARSREIYIIGRDFVRSDTEGQLQRL